MIAFVFFAFGNIRIDYNSPLKYSFVPSSFNKYNREYKNGDTVILNVGL